MGNFLSVDGSQSRESYEDRARPKPDVYKALVNLLSLDDQWILDPISGSGKYEPMFKSNFKLASCKNSYNYVSHTPLIKVPSYSISNIKV